MSDWKFAHTHDGERLAEIRYFQMTKVQDDREIEFTIKVLEFVTPKDPSMHFFAVADKQTNQRTAPYTPSGWGRTLLEALTLCMENVRRFRYEPESEGV